MSCPAHALAQTRRFLTVEDVDDIQMLVRMLPERWVNVVDLGAGSGTTALAVFCARPEDISVWTVDIDLTALNWAQRNLEANGSYGVWTPQCMAAHEFAEYWINAIGKDFTRHPGVPRVDLLLHDADHSEEAVRRDLAAWLPLMAPGGLVWVHDYKPMAGAAESYPGVAKVVAELDLDAIPCASIGWAGRVR